MAYLVFFVLAIFVGIVVPLVPLILGLVFAHSKKALHPKRWYFLSVLALAWIAVASVLVSMIAK